VWIASDQCFRILAPPGDYRIDARSELAGGLASDRIHVEADESQRVDLTYTGADPRNRIVLAIGSDPMLMTEIAPQNVQLTRRGVGPVRATTAQGSRYVFDDLPAAFYDVEISDPRYLPWSRTGVSPGTMVHAKLVANGAVDLAVTDSTTMLPAESFRLSVVYEQVKIDPDEWDLAPSKSTSAGHVVVSGLLPGTFRLRIRKPGFAICDVEIEDLKPGETRAATAVLSRGEVIAGRAFLGDESRPAAGVRVLLVPRGMETWTATSRGAMLESPTRFFRPISTTTDAEGRFRFDHAPDGFDGTVRAALHVWLLEEQSLDASSDAARREHMRLVLPRSQHVRLRLVGMDRSKVQPTLLFIRPSQPELRGDAELSYRGLRFDVDASGRVDAGVLPLGASEWQLWADWNDASPLARGTLELAGADAEVEMVLDLRDTVRD
jgi:hypothetical protein